MQEYIIDKAIDQIWCNPRQDNQHVIRPHRVTEGAGALTKVLILDRWLTLPNKSVRTHVYQVGQISPALLGLFESVPTWTKETWYTFEEAMNKLPLYMNIYNETGINIPRFNAHFMFTREKCLVFAIKVDDRINVDLKKDNIYFRFYTSAHLKNYDPETPAKPIVLKGYEIVERDNIPTVINDYRELASNSGLTEVFVNGELVNEASVRTLKEGSIVELVYDCTVKRVVTWKIKNLKTFTSTLDKKTKYILHYAKQTPTNVIDFHDDTDVYIQTKGELNTKVGRFYIPNTPGAKRNLTHRDYSIVGDYVDFIARDLANSKGMITPDLLEFEVVLKIREAGYKRELIHDSSRIYQLYRLDDQRIMMAMTGVETQVPVWTASALESSAYINLMGSDYKDITIDKVEQAYGYNTITRIIADAPIKTVDYGTQPVAVLGYAAALGSSVSEYDRNGRFLGSFRHNSPDDSYEAKYRNTSLVQPIVGTPSLGFDDVFGTNNITVPDNCSWRLYYCQFDYSVNPAVPDNKWKDVTDSDRYTIVDGKIVWTKDENDQYLCLRTDRNILEYSFEAKTNLGNLLFALSEVVTIDNKKIRRTMQIPGGDLQIFLNGYNLVRDIDYIINFPYVCINAQKFFKQPCDTESQSVHIRFTGFCREDLSIPKPTEIGFVRNGLISNDKRFRNHDNKIMHISVGGCVKHRDDVKFYEDTDAWEPRSPINGQPYQINEVITPLRAFTKSDTYDLLKIDDQIGKSVDDYMSLYWKPWDNEPLSSSEARWRITSPFFACLVELCRTGSWWWYDYERLTDEEVLELCKPYENLLAYDPIYPENELPDEHVNITPTRYNDPVHLSRAQYRVLETVLRLYAPGKLGLNNYITFSVQHERPL